MPIFQGKKNTILYIFLIFLMITAFYAIFNAGNPNSLFRFIIKDPSYDILITFILGAFILFISLSLNRRKGESPIDILLENNRDYIIKLKDKGRSDNEIADSFLRELKIKNPLSKRLIKNKTLKYLEQLNDPSR